MPHPWFALTVKPRHEKAVGQALTGRGIEGFVPLYVARRRWSDRVKSSEFPLFPGYAFCRMDYRDRLLVMNMPSITSIVGFGSTPGIVTEDEIRNIRTVLASGLPAGPWPFLRVGHAVRIDKGALAGLEGILVREKDSFRVVVSVQLLQRAVAVEVDREVVQAVNSQTSAATACI